MSKENHCYYSGLPSPMAYMDDATDYDGMGNQGRFPKQKKKENMFKNILKKIMIFRVIRNLAKRKNKIL
jgi:hypothetical protein